MPMQKFSTLLYCVNRFQKESTREVLQNESEFETTEFINETGPSERSVENILNFARSYDVLETESAGYVEMILN